MASERKYITMQYRELAHPHYSLFDYKRKNLNRTEFVRIGREIVLDIRLSFGFSILRSDKFP